LFSLVYTDSPISVSSSNPSPKEQTLKKPKNIEKSPTTPPPLQIFNPKTAKIKVCEETLIEIERGKLGLGLSIVGGCDTQLQAIIIHDIYENGAAFKDKRLHIGDQILKVNNIDLKNVTHDEALNILRRQTTEYIQMLIYRNYETLDDEEDKFDVFQVDLYKKFGKGLGVSIIGRRDGFGVFISHIIEGGCAAKDGRLMIGDLILEVNDKDIRKAPYNEVAFILKTLPPQTKVTLKIGRLKSNISSRKNSFSSTATTTSPSSKTTTNHVEIIKK
jgi:C-terminal processing protease CtpA/Prc